MLNIENNYGISFLRNSQGGTNLLQVNRQSEIPKFIGLQSDTVSFSSNVERKKKKKKKKKSDNDNQNKPVKKKKTTNKTKATHFEYKSVLLVPLKSQPNPDFDKELSRIDGIKAFGSAKKRISSLSRYLKEDMVGFIVPEYEKETNNSGAVKKGGYQWFEKGLENLLRGCHNNTGQIDYKKEAKEFFGLLATHDKYWKSPEFIEYLSTLKQNEAVKSTIAAVKDLQQSDPVSFTGYFTPMKKIQKILDDGCAYTGVKMVSSKNKNKSISADQQASAEHILPRSIGGKSDDSNYLIVCRGANSLRGNMPLMDYLKGANAA